MDVVLVVVRKRVLIWLVALGGMSAVMVGNGGAAPRRAIASNRQAAMLVAGQLLGGVARPAGSRTLRGEPAGDGGQLAAPLVGAFFAAEVDLRAFWTTTASPGATLAIFQSHLPSGAKLVTSMSGDESAGAVYALGTSRQFLIGPEQIMLRAVTLRDGLTGVRADAQVRYRSPRPAFQRVPLSARLVQVTKADGGAKPLVSLVVTHEPAVRKLAHLVDGLPFVGASTGSSSCPSFGDPIDTFIFRARPAGPALATVSESAYTPTSPFPCAPTTLTIRGRRLAPLLDGGILLKQASALLGVRLTG